MLSAGFGDLAVLIAHETLHLNEDGSWRGSVHPDRRRPARGWWGPFTERENAAFSEVPMGSAPICANRMAQFGHCGTYSRW